MLADMAFGVADSLPQIRLKCSLPSSCLDHPFSYDISASSIYEIPPARREVPDGNGFGTCEERRRELDVYW